METIIALDLMGGDMGVAATVPGAVAALDQFTSLGLVVVGRRADIYPAYAALLDHPRLRFHDASEVVDMHEAPTGALKAKPDSSMRRAIDLVNDGSAAACVSAGNTGALTAMGTLVIKRLPGIERPAIVRALPRAGGHVHMLDLGASNDASPKRLFQFGIMGAMLSQYFDDNSHPTIGLLNIGTEEGKGSDSLNEAANLFRRSPLNYIGYVEGNDIYDGQVDVIVCDGFSGNVALKTSEGLSVMLHAILKEEYGRNFMSRMAGLCSLSVLRRIKARTDRRRFNGAMLLGLRRPVIKSHGSADSVGITQAIKVALDVVEKDIVTHIADQMEQLQD